MKNDPSEEQGSGVVAIVPIKEHSSRVQGKNFRIMNGRPLYSYILDILSQTSKVTLVVVNTDSKTLRDQLSLEYPEVKIIQRPEHLCGDAVPVNLLIEDTIKHLQLREETVCLQTHTTNPLVTPATLEAALLAFASNGSCDSLYSVKKLQSRLYNESGSPINHNPQELIPTQDLPAIYEENSCVYVFTPGSFRKRCHRIGDSPMLFPMSVRESQDIDTEDDFRYTEWLMATRPSSLRRVLVSGVLGGIGRSIARCFFNHGWEVYGIDVQCPTGSDDILHCMKRFDVVNIVHLEEQKQYFASIHGGLHCLVNNAALQHCGPASEFSESLLDSMYECNVKALFSMSKNAFPLLRETKGALINISSVHATHTSASIAGYAATKGAVSAMTRALAIEYAPQGVRVNAIAPGAVDTPMLIQGLERQGSGTTEALATLKGKHLRGTIMSGADVAEAALFLADGQRSRNIVGHVLVVDGGATVRLSTET